ncbi:hypothetical protein [Microbacterium sp. SL75]|uniref:hypothetical protein n=1 Tax=Microbacterium sp. SL75 TaxID=2995140 RepID=UPI00226F5A41|nr:hypothetical protein [Microbacterium sp. SL75]WAC70394.1 hypothetical protein OVA17_06785 [Microbacterium sp. SL75]
MPFRTKATLQAWLDEYAASGAGGGGIAFVADQEPVDGIDSGLVIFPLANATTSVYLAPIAVGAPDWRVTFEAQPEITELSPQSVQDLCRELLHAADLCAFLQRKSIEHVAEPAADARDDLGGSPVDAG